jgi:hypothetical protein
MRTQVDGRLLDEAQRLQFRFACEDCAHFGEEDEVCSLGYVAAPRRRALAGRVLELCKTYELA